MPHFGTILDCSSFTPSSQPNGSAIHYAIPLLASVRIYPHHQVRGLAQIVSWAECQQQSHVVFHVKHPVRNRLGRKICNQPD